LGEGKTSPMPLTRYKIIGHDQERLAFIFSMLNDERVVQCQISDAALDELAGMKGTESSVRLAQFLSLRDTIEQIASQLYDQTPIVHGHVVRIFSKHISRDPDFML
jgi:predicted ATP-dependent serine protease